MVPQFIVTCPIELARLAGEISSELVHLPIIAVELQLLLPLDTPNEVERCLNDAQSFSCHAYNLHTIRRDAVKVLGLTPIFKAWRVVWSEFHPDAVQNFMFNINLPPSSIANAWADPKIYWRRSVPNIGGLAVMEGRVYQAVLEVATVMRVRSKGEAKFSLKGVEEYVAMQAQSVRREGNDFDSLKVTLQQLSTRETESGRRVPRSLSSSSSSRMTGKVSAK